MTTYIKTLKEDNGDIVYPQTITDAVYTSGGQTLETEISKYVTAEDIASSVASFGTVTTGMLDDDAVTTAKIDDGAVTSDKIDFTTFPHVIACGTKNYGALNAQGYTDMSVTIPTQTDTNYYVSIANDNGNAYWTKLYFKIGGKTTTGFTIYVYNDGTTGQNTGAGTVNYVVARNN